MYHDVKEKEKWGEKERQDEERRSDDVTFLLPTHEFYIHFFSSWNTINKVHIHNNSFTVFMRKK